MGRPTIVNNVETYNNLPAIMLRGPEWYIGLSAGKSKDPGTKIYGASGKVKFLVFGNYHLVRLHVK